VNVEQYISTRIYIFNTLIWLRCGIQLICAIVLDPI